MARHTTRPMPNRSIVLTLLLIAFAALPSALWAWPPWLSIEAPVNPYDPATRGAFLLVRTAVHAGSTDHLTITGTAEGLVDGKRESVRLSFRPTSQPGVFALNKMWPSEGTWTLVITLGPPSIARATAVVDLAPTGEIASIRVPLERNERSDLIPRTVRPQEIDSSLVARAGSAVAARASRR